ncbi:zinc-binding dehydrogenase [Haloplanus ruber]|uniref:Zinc-binding dehydrogenase n=1 Tax=Haloplanus ruber TaxID=869892 RepID=A0ABD6D155_9EURY
MAVSNGRHSHDGLRLWGTSTYPHDCEHQGRFEVVIDNVDIVVDTVRDEILAHSVDVLRKNGVLVSVVGQPSGVLTTNHDIDIQAVSGQSSSPSLLTTISELIGAGEVHPTISAEFPLEIAAHAHEVGETEHVQGKLVLRVA